MRKSTLDLGIPILETIGSPLGKLADKNEKSKKMKNLINGSIQSF